MILLSVIFTLICLEQVIEHVLAGEQRYKVFGGKSVKQRSSSAISESAPSTEGNCLSKCKKRSDCAGITFDKKNCNCILIHCGRIELESNTDASTFVIGIEYYFDSLQKSFPEYNN